LLYNTLFKFNISENNVFQTNDLSMHDAVYISLGDISKPSITSPSQDERGGRAADYVDYISNLQTIQSFSNKSLLSPEDPSLCKVPIRASPALKDLVKTRLLA
jgi:hypothetical protein